jgi:SAM-dependent methyltransferase
VRRPGRSPLQAWARRRRLRGELARRFPRPTAQWNEEYARGHADLVSFLLGDDDTLTLFAEAGRLPRGFGVGYDERVVEYPWLLAQRPRGRVLDAGSTLNHAHVLGRLLPQLDALEIVTLAPEADAFPELGITYAFADLRELPYEDGSFDTVVSLSTVEHVGMDTRVYGADEPRAEDPRAEARRAVRELRRVAAPGGTVLVSVPYGVPSDHGWFRQFDRGDVEDLATAAAPASVSVAVYRYASDGWQVSSLEGAADAMYWDHHSDPERPADGAAAARAVACLRLRV